MRRTVCRESPPTASEQAGASLGRLLASHQLETRREVLDIVTVRAEEAGEHLGVGPNATLARRTYTIVVGKQAVAAVTEWLAPGRLTATTMESRTRHAFARARLTAFTADCDSFPLVGRIGFEFDR